MLDNEMFDNEDKNNSDQNKNNKTNEQNKGGAQDDKKDEKLFSESEVDKRVTDAIKKREAKLKAEYDETLKAKIEEALKEQKRLSKLSEEEKQKEELDKRIKEIEERERKLNNSQLKNDMLVELAKSNLDTSAVDILVRENDTDAKQALKRLNLFKDAVEKATKAVLEQKMKDSSFVPNAGKTKELTREEFLKLSYSERVKIMTENPALYETLTK